MSLWLPNLIFPEWSSCSWLRKLAGYNIYILQTVKIEENYKNSSEKNLRDSTHKSYFLIYFLYTLITHSFLWVVWHKRHTLQANIHLFNFSYSTHECYPCTNCAHISEVLRNFYFVQIEIFQLTKVSDSPVRRRRELSHNTPLFHSTSTGSNLPC
jgi:hypothetical protein